MPEFAYQRISIVGTSASGKSTLAKALAAKTGIPHVELDAFYHWPNWEKADAGNFLARLHEAVEQDAWIVDGNYGFMVRSIVWSEADLIIWLDYPFRIVFYRVLKRTLLRLIRREELWNGNRESLRMTFSKESIILWVLQTYWKRKREFSRALDKDSGRQFLRFQHPTETEKWLATIA